MRCCMWIIETLRRQKDGLTLAEINSLFVAHTDLSLGQPLTRATFRNYLLAISDSFKMVISCNRSNYRYYIECECDEEKTNWLIRSMAVGQLIREQRQISDRVMLEREPAGMKYYPTVSEALLTQTALQLTYQKFCDTEPYQCRIEPYGLKLSGGRWYMVARKDRRPHLQVFAFDRIQHLELLHGQRYDFELPFDPHTYFAHSFGVINAPEPERVVIRVSQKLYNYLRTKPLHPSQREAEHSQIEAESAASVQAGASPEKQHLLSYYIRPSVDFENELMRWMPGLVVIEPQSLRQRIKERVQKMADEYGA